VINIQAYTYGGAGAQGLIVITYTPAIGNFFLMF
jgi:hypothetical protein